MERLIEPHEGCSDGLSCCEMILLFVFKIFSDCTQHCTTFPHACSHLVFILRKVFHLLHPCICWQLNNVLLVVYSHMSTHCYDCRQQLVMMASLYWVVSPVRLGACLMSWQMCLEPLKTFLHKRVSTTPCLFLFCICPEISGMTPTFLGSLP